MSRKYPTNRYIPGTYKRECDICGFDFLRSELRKNYKGLLVCSDDYEDEHPREKIILPSPNAGDIRED